MKPIHLFITIDFPPQTGGVATYLSHLCKHSQTKNFIVLANIHKDSHEFDAKENYAILREDFHPNWKNAIKIVKDILKQNKIDHIHVSHVLPIGYIALFLKLLKKIPYTIYLHGLDLKLAQTKFHKKLLLRLILRFAHRVVVNSNNTKNIAKKVAPFTHTKTKIIYPCPHDDLLEYTLDQNVIKQYEQNLVLVTVARLVKRKGHERVLELLPQLVTKFPQLKYVIVGEGPYFKKLYAIVRQLQLEQYVDFLGPVSQELLPTYYSIADIFVMPTQSIKNDVEGFGITFLEANLFKKPVIGGNNGGVTEAIIHGKTGYLINDYSNKQLFDILTMLLENKALREEIGENGYQRVMKEFNWPNQTSKLGL